MAKQNIYVLVDVESGNPKWLSSASNPAPGLKGNQIGHSRLSPLGTKAMIQGDFPDAIVTLIEADAGSTVMTKVQAYAEVLTWDY